MLQVVRTPTSFRWTTVPGNNGFVVPIDSTSWPDEMSYAALTANPAPGKRRGCHAGVLINYTVKCTGQNVTVDEQILTGVAGTNADWETQGGGTFVVTAGGATAVRSFKPLQADWRILVTAGATGPTTLVILGFVVYDVTDHAS